MEGSEHVGRGEGDSGGEATSRVWRRAGGMRQVDLEAAKGSGQASVELYFTASCVRTRGAQVVFLR